MKNMSRVFSIIFVASLVIYTNSTSCKLTSFKKIHPPRKDLKYIAFNGKADNGSITAKSCGPPGSPPITYTCSPNTVTIRTTSVELNFTASLLSDFSSGIAELRINYTAPGSSPESFIGLTPLDCSSFPDDIPCPFPLYEKDWISVSCILKPRTLLKVGKYEFKGSVTNSSMVSTLCIQGRLHIYE